MLTKLQQDLTASLKSGKRDRVETMRFLIAGVRNAAIAKYGNNWETSLTDEDVLDVIKKQVKTHKESIEAFTKAERAELVAKEKSQLMILEAFLPSQMSDEKLREMLVPVAASGEANFGLLMKQAMAIVKGQADGGRVASILKSLLPK